MKYLAAAALALLVASPALAQQAPGTDPAQRAGAGDDTHGRGDANKFMTNEARTNGSRETSGTRAFTTRKESRSAI